MFITNHIQRGQTLIEALSALAIIALILSAISVAITTSLDNATYNQNQTLATKYAEDGSEIVHQLRDDDYTKFQNYGGSYCLGKGQTQLQSKSTCPPPNIDKVFLRQVQIQKNGCGAQIAQVTISVAFRDGKCTSATQPYCHVVTNTTCLSTTNPIQTP